MLGLDEWALSAADATKQPLGVFVRNADFERADWLIEHARSRLLKGDEPAAVAGQMWVAMLRTPVLSNPADAQIVAAETAAWVMRAHGEAISANTRSRLSDLAEQVAIGAVAHDDLAAQIRRSTSRVLVGAQLPQRTHIFVGNPVRGRDETELAELSTWRYIAAAAVQQAGEEMGIELRCTWPAVETPMEADAVWDAATTTLWGRAGLAIFLDDGNGSTGMGIELMLCGFVQHVLHLRPRGCKLSRQAEGMSKEANLRFDEFRNHDELHERILTAVHDLESVLREHNSEPGNSLLWARPVLELRRLWSARDEDGKKQACAESGLKYDRVERLLDHEVFAHSCLDDLRRLALSLDTTLHELIAPQEHLRLSQKDDDQLRLYVREAELEGHEALRLRAEGERYIAVTLGRARPPWPMLHEQMRDET